MKEAVLAPQPWSLVTSRLTDFFELTKPRVQGLVLFTVATGCILAGGASLSWLVLLHALIGTTLVAAGASALNQWFERDSDALMRRTRQRPLPAGRLQPWEAVAFGIGTGILGLTYLAVTLNHTSAAWTAGFTYISYAFIYTPLKTRTTLNTLIGAVPGALPPVIGWTAVRGTLGPEVVILFLIVFLWQIPHFLAIAWMYREEYGRAGLQMLPVYDPKGIRTGRWMVVYCASLLPASLMPVLLGFTGPLYAVGAVVLGIGFLRSTLVFREQPCTEQARRVLKASLVYLPMLLAFLIVDHFSLELIGRFRP